MNNPLVSVIIPAYNARRTLGEAIECVLNQTFTDLECIIVDDGSTDGTGDFVAGFTDRRIVYHFQENQERSIARNVGISLSRGTFLAFLDADDLWLPGKLEKQVQLLLERKDLGLVYCDVMYFDGQTGHDIGVYSQLGGLEKGMVFEKLLWNGNFIQSPTPLVRKEVFDRVGGLDPSLVPLEDWDLWLRIAHLYPVDYVPEVLARYRWRKEAVSLAAPSKMLHDRYLRLLGKIETQYCQENWSLRWKIQVLRSQALLRRAASGFWQTSPTLPGAVKG